MFLDSLRRFLVDRFNQGVIWNIAGLVVLGVGGIVSNLIIVRLRGAEALGVFNQAFALYIVLSQIAVSGVHISVLRAVSYNQTDVNSAADQTNAGMLLVALIALPLCALAALIADPIGQALNSTETAEAFFYTIPGLPLFAFNKVLLNAINGLNHMRAYAVLRTARFVFIPAAIVGIIALGMDDAAIALSLTLAELCLLIALGGYVYGRLLPWRRARALRAHMRRHLSFGTRSILFGVLLELNTRIDVLVLGLFTDDQTVGIFSFAAIIAEGFAQLPLAVQYNVDPMMGDAFARQQLQEIPVLARRIRRLFWPFMVLVGSIAVLTYPLVFLLIGEGGDMDVSWSVFALLAAGVVLSAGHRPFRGIVVQGGYPGVQTLMTLLLIVVNVVINVSLIPVMGVHGAALGTMLTWCLEAVLIVVVARRLFGVGLGGFG